jgi:glycosyltransferase involved in cell wall biosynthesis
LKPASPRILVINNTTLLSAGTTRSLILNLKHLHSKYDFTVAAPTHSEGLPAVLAEMGIPFQGLKPGRLSLPWGVFRLVGRSRYNLVYANNLDDEARYAFWAAKVKGLPFIWHVREPIRKRRKAWTIKYADAVIANSRYTADALTSVAGVRSPVAIPNGVEIREFAADRTQARKAVLDELGLPADSFVMVNVGILRRGKNQLDAVEVMRLVCRRDAKARLLCVGSPSLSDPDYVNQVRARASELGLSDKVRLLGLRPDVSPYLRCADLLLHTSVFETQGRVLIEAMAAELPVVAYNVGGIPESVLDGETGFLVPEGDIAAVVEAVCGLMADPALRHRMGEAGRRRVLQYFTAEGTARRVNEVIRLVLRTGRN